MNRILTTRSASIIFFSLVFSIQPVAAQSSIEVDEASSRLEEIIVSDLRPVAGSDVPASIEVLSAQEIAETTVQHFEELTQFVPNLNWAGGVSRPRYFQIRGIGERSQYEGAPNASVGFIIDDLDFSGFGSIATLFDVEQVEVLRGPQGTRYGANALAGLIYVKSRAPTDEFDFRVNATAGSDDASSFGIALGGAVNDQLAYRVVGHQYQSNGFRENAFLGRDDTNGRDEFSSRIKLRYQPGNNWQFDVTALHVDIDNGYDAFAIDNGFVTQSDRPGQDSQTTSALVVSSEGALSHALSLRSISGIARSDVVFSFDADWGNNEFWQPVVYDFFSSTQRDRQTLQQEFRLKSNPAQGAFQGRVDWVVGALFLNNKESNITNDDGNFEGFLANSSIGREFEATNLALFADASMDISERVMLNAGLRIESRDAQYQDTGGDAFDPNEDSVGGQIALVYSINDSTNAYAKVARGYKAGGFNLGLPEQAPDSALFYDAEFLWNYEIGLKGSYLNDRLGVNATAFLMQRRDQQVQTSAQLDPTNPTTFIFFTDNAGEGTNNGLELSVDYLATDTLQMYASLGLLDTSIKKLANSSAQDGRDQAHAPNYSFALGARYDFSNGWFARVDVTGKDKFYFSDTHNQQSQKYSLTNARVGYEKDNWAVSVWGRNVFDQDYAVRGFYFGNEPARDFVDTLYTRQGDPSSFGITFEYRLTQ